MKKWDYPEYQKIINVEIKNDQLLVEFANGDKIKTNLSSIISVDASNILFDKLHFNSYEIIVPTAEGNIDIPWDMIRALTDRDYSKFLADEAEEQANAVGVKIKRLREKRHYKSNELAELAGLTPQTISRIEKGHTDVSFVTLKRILGAMGYSLQDLVDQEIELESESHQKTLDKLIKRLSKVGIDSNFLMKRIIPSGLRNAISQSINPPELLLNEISNYVSRIYQWNNDELWRAKNLIVRASESRFVLFKKPTESDFNQVKAYSHYAHYLSSLILKCSTNKKTKEFPQDIEEFRQTLITEYGQIELSTILNYAWDLGIHILPLDDSGVFHGASWNIDDEFSIVLKQKTKAHARWAFDLLHEIYHVLAHLDQKNFGIVEADEISPFSNQNDDKEQEANSFASKVLLGNDAEAMAQLCVQEANWNLPKLKEAVKKVAKKRKVNVDVLANYLAYRLSYQGENWWGPAMGLQVTEPIPYILVLNELKKRIALDKLNPIDANLLINAFES
jgi:transcriptional regulator with XRE-family HTH domain/Zn-dependent peptidase ImmA (M78 family)